MSTRQPAIKDLLYEPPGPRTLRITRVLTALSALICLGILALIIKLFYDNGQLDKYYWDLFASGSTWRFIATGLLGTLEVALASALIAFVVGMLFMLLRISQVRILRWISIGLIEFTRGVPTLLLIYFFFLAVPQFGLNITPFFKIVLPVAISASGVVAEVLRSGVNAVPKGQNEAALSLGMGRWKAFFKIIFPQGIRYIVPTLIAELVIVLKDTTFAYVVNYPDLMQNARVLISNHDSLLPVYLVTAVIYILINYVLNRIAVAISHRRYISVQGLKWN